jgi:signal peptidase I
MDEASGKAESVGTERTESRASQDSNLREYLESILVTVILAIFVTTFIAQAFEIPSPSMMPALRVGDHLLVNKFIFQGKGAWYERFLPYRAVHRGDVVVFKYPYEDHPYYVKRVIGMPGDHIRITNQRVYVNDKLLDEPYVIHDLANADPFMFDFPPKDLGLIENEIPPGWAAEIRKATRDGELVVPPKDYFVMGDNRDNSADSRYWGFVPQDAIVGRPLLIYWSVRETSGEENASSWGEKIRDISEILFHLPSRVRWDRMFQEVH